MAPRKIDKEAVASALKSEGLDVAVQGEGAAWNTVFNINGEQREVTLFRPPSGAYFVAFSLVTIQTPKLDKLPPAKLVELIRANTDIDLAKVEYYDFDDATHGYAAASQCSVENYTGSKLRARMEACAQLVARMESILG